MAVQFIRTSKPMIPALLPLGPLNENLKRSVAPRQSGRHFSRLHRGSRRRGTDLAQLMRCSGISAEFDGDEKAFSRIHLDDRGHRRRDPHRLPATIVIIMAVIVNTARRAAACVCPNTRRRRRALPGFFRVFRVSRCSSARRAARILASSHGQDRAAAMASCSRYSRFPRKRSPCRWPQRLSLAVAAVVPSWRATRGHRGPGAIG